MLTSEEELLPLVGPGPPSRAFVKIRPTSRENADISTVFEVSNVLEMLVTI
jgi:hypothetical protein